MPQENKKKLRECLKQKRALLDEASRTQKSTEICQSIIALSAFQSANSIGLYHAFKEEVELRTLWKKALELRKTCCFPSLKDNNTLLFLPANLQTPWKSNRFGILEPDINPSESIPPSKLDILFLPLLGFDLRGNRLGMGAGYYDRTLLDKNGKLLVGVAYEFQKVDTLKPDPWDIPLDLVITENNTYWSKP